MLISITLGFFVSLSIDITGYFSSSTAKRHAVLTNSAGSPTLDNRCIGIGFFLFGFFNSLGVASALPVISSEISIARLRSKGQGIGLKAQSLGAWILSFFIPYLHNVNHLIGAEKLGFFFAGLSALALVVIWFDVPETKGPSFAKLDCLFHGKISARKFHVVEIPSLQIVNEDVSKAGRAMC